MTTIKETYDLLVELEHLTNFEKQATIMTMTVKHKINQHIVHQLTDSLYQGVKSVLEQCTYVLPVSIYANVKWNKRTKQTLEPLFALLYSELTYDQLVMLRDMLAKKELMLELLSGEDQELVNILEEYGQTFTHVAKNMESITDIHHTLQEKEEMIEKKSDLSGYKMVLKPKIFPIESPNESKEETINPDDWLY